MNDKMLGQLRTAGSQQVVVAFKKNDGRTRRQVGRVETLTATHVRVMGSNGVHRNITLSGIRHVSLTQGP